MLQRNCGFKRTTGSPRWLEQRLWESEVVAAAVEQPPAGRVVAGCCEQFSCVAVGPTFALICDYKARSHMASCPHERLTRGWPSGTSGQSACHKAGKHRPDAFHAPSQRASLSGPFAWTCVSRWRRCTFWCRRALRGQEVGALAWCEIRDDGVARSSGHIDDIQTASPRKNQDKVKALIFHAAIEIRGPLDKPAFAPSVTNNKFFSAQTLATVLQLQNTDTSLSSTSFEFTDKKFSFG